MEPLISKVSSGPKCLGLCELTCSWLTADCKEIDDVVSYRTQEESTGTCCNTDGITLKLPEGAADTECPCLLTIRCKPPFKVLIDAVDILANARHVELFSSSGEYLTTLQGFRVDEDLGYSRRLFALQQTLELPASKLSIKFVSLETPTELWLHSIHITTCPAASSSLLISHPLAQFTGLVHPQVDMNKVSSMLSEMGKQLTPRAEELKQSISSKQMEKAQNVGNMPVMLTSMLNQMNMGGSLSSKSFKEGMASPADLFNLLSFGLSQNTAPGTTRQQSDGEIICRNLSNRDSNASNGSASECIHSHNKESLSSAASTDVLTETLFPELVSSSAISRRCVHCNAVMPLEDLEQRLVAEIAGAEKRLEKHFTETISNTEKRLTERLDALLLFFQQNLLSISDRNLADNAGHGYKPVL